MGPTLFPTWPIWRFERARALLAIVLVVLFLPKLLAVVLALRRGESADYGGAAARCAACSSKPFLGAVRTHPHGLLPLRALNLLGRAVGWSGGGGETRNDLARRMAPSWS
jgi:membrane glycosyltransferase